MTKDKDIRIIPHNDHDADAAKVLEYAANLPEVKKELHDSLDAALESLMNTYPKPSLTIVKRK